MITPVSFANFAVPCTPFFFGEPVMCFLKADKTIEHTPMIFDGFSNSRLFAAETPFWMSEHFIGLPVIGIQLMSERILFLIEEHVSPPGSPPKSYVLSLFATSSCFRPYTRAADEATGILNSFHSFSTSFLPSRSYRKKYDMLSAKAFLTFLSTRISPLVQYWISQFCMLVCV